MTTDQNGQNNDSSNAVDSQVVLDALSQFSDRLESMFAPLVTAIGKMGDSLGSLGISSSGSSSGINTSNGGAATNPAGWMGAASSAPTVDTSMFKLVADEVRALTNQIKTANAKPPEVITGASRYLYTSGQVAEMQRHAQQIGSGRVNVDIPTFATNGPGFMPMSPLSTLHRSNDLLGLNLGISDRSTPPGANPYHDRSMGMGDDLRRFLSGSESVVRTLQGSLGKSFEFSQNQGQTGDDYRNTVFARSKMNEFYSAQASLGAPISDRDKGLFNVGLNVRAMRDSSMLTGQANSSLGRLVQAHQTAGTKYSPFIAMDTGSEDPGATVSTRKIMKSDQVGSYVSNLMKTMSSLDNAMTGTDIRQAAVNDLKAKADSIRDNVASNIISPGMVEKLQKAGIGTSSIDLAGIRSTQSEASEAQNQAKILQEKFYNTQTQLNELHNKTPESEIKRDSTGKVIGYDNAKTQKLFEESNIYGAEHHRQMGLATLANDLYNTKTTQMMQSFSPQDIERMKRNPDKQIRELGLNTEVDYKLRQGANVLDNKSSMTTADRVKGAVDDKVASGNEFAAAMMKNLQWSLMFAFSGTVFQALSQIPQQATYETVQPVYSGISNIMGLSPLKNEMMGFGEQAPAILGEVQDRTNSLQSLLGSRAAATQAVGSALDIAKTQPIHFTEAMQVMTSMATLPSIRSQAANPTFQKTMLENVQMLGMVNPEQGTTGALFAIREMLAGQYRSLQMRFQMSPDLLASYSGMTTQQMKSQSGVQMMNTLNQSLMGMFGGSEILMRKGAEGEVLTKNIRDTLTSGIISPMNDVQNPKTLALLRDAAGSDPNGIGRLSNLLPASQQEAIKGAALESVAGRFGIKYERGDSINELTAKYTNTKGGSFDENSKLLGQAYTEQTKHNVESTYGTPAGAQALILTGINKALGSVLTTFSPGEGISGSLNGFLSPFMRRMGTFNDKTEEADRIGGGNGDAMRKTAAQELVSGFFSDVRDSIHSVASGVNKSELSNILKQVTDTVRVGAQEVFAPIGKSIMIQTAKTAIDIPRVMIGGSISAIGSELLGNAGSAIGSLGHSMGRGWRSLTGGGTEEEKKRDREEGPTHGTEEFLRTTSSLLGMVGWQQGIAGLRTSPLMAASKLASFSMLSKGFSDFADRDAAGGIGSTLASAAFMIAPGMVGKGLNKWVASSDIKAVQAAEGGAAAGTGGIISSVVSGLGSILGLSAYGRAKREYNENISYVTRQVRNPTTNVLEDKVEKIEGLSKKGAFSEFMFGAPNRNLSASDYKDRMPIKEGETNLDYHNRITARQAEDTHFYNTASRGGIGQQRLLGAERYGGFLRSIGGRALGTVAGVGATAIGAVDLATQYKDYKDPSKHVSGMSLAGGVLESVGGLATTFGALVPAIGPVVEVFGLLASAGGVLLSHIGAGKSEKEAKEAEAEKHAVGDREAMIRQQSTEPTIEMQTSSGKSFDAYVRNARLESVLDPSKLSEMRNQAQDLATYHITATSNEPLKNLTDLFKQDKESDAASGWKTKSNAEKEDASTKFGSSILNIMQPFMSMALQHPESTFEGEKGTGNIRQNALQTLTAQIKGTGVSGDMADKMAAAIVSTFKAIQPGFDQRQEAMRANLKETAPEAIRNSMEDVWFGNTRPEAVDKSSFDNPNSMQTLPEKVATNVGRANLLASEGAAASDSMLTTGVGVWGMNSGTALGFRKLQGEYEARMLEGGHMDPKKLEGQEGLQMMLRVAEVRSPEEAQRLGQQVLMKHMTGLTKNEAGFTEQMDKGEMPSEFSTRTQREMDIFSTALQTSGNGASEALNGVANAASVLTTVFNQINGLDKAKVGSSVESGAVSDADARDKTAAAAVKNANQLGSTSKEISPVSDAEKAIASKDPPILSFMDMLQSKIGFDNENIKANKDWIKADAHIRQVSKQQALENGDSSSTWDSAYKTENITANNSDSILDTSMKSLISTKPLKNTTMLYGDTPKDAEKKKKEVMNSIQDLIDDHETNNFFNNDGKGLTESEKNFQRKFGAVYPEDKKRNVLMSSHLDSNVNSKLESSHSFTKNVKDFENMYKREYNRDGSGRGDQRLSSRAGGTDNIGNGSWELPYFGKNKDIYGYNSNFGSTPATMESPLTDMTGLSTKGFLDQMDTIRGNNLIDMTGMSSLQFGNSINAMRNEAVGSSLWDDGTGPQQTVRATAGMSMSEIGDQMQMMSRNPGTTFNSGGLSIEYATQAQMAASAAMAQLNNNAFQAYQDRQPSTITAQNIYVTHTGN